MRDTFVKTLIELAKKNKNIELITGDLGFGVLKPYWETLPDQFTNAGIAEQNMTSLAAGMAMEGKTVVLYSIGNFPTMRCLEQIRNDCTYHKANVKIVCVGGGLVYGSLGMSHHATEDLAVMRALPDMTVLAPGDKVEAEAATKAMIEYPGTCYLRLGRGGERQIHKSLPDFRIGKAIKLRDDRKPSGYNIAIFSAGAILDETADTCDKLEERGIGVVQYSFPTVKPVDRETIIECLKSTDGIFTVEEHNIIGGFGSAVAEVAAEMGTGTPVYRIGMNDQYCSKVGTQEYLRNEYGLSAEKITEYIMDKIKG